MQLKIQLYSDKNSCDLDFNCFLSNKKKCCKKYKKNGVYCKKCPKK